MAENTYNITNKLSEQEFYQAVYGWLIDGDTPDDILDTIIPKYELKYIPLHVYENEYVGWATMSLAYNRYEVYSAQDKKGKKIIKNHLVTDRQPYTQPLKGIVQTLVYAGNSLNSNEISFVESLKCQSQHLLNLDKGISHYIEMISLFKNSKEVAWNTVGMNKAFEQIQNETIEILPTPSVENLKLNITLKEIYSYSVIVPYWWLRYNYKGENYYAIVDGTSITTTPKVSGSKPLDKERKKKIADIKEEGWSNIIGVLLFSFLMVKITHDHAIVITAITLTPMALIYLSSSMRNKINQLKFDSKNKRMLSAVKKRMQSMPSRDVEEFIGL